MKFAKNATKTVQKLQESFELSHEQVVKVRLSQSHKHLCILLKRLPENSSKIVQFLENDFPIQPSRNSDQQSSHRLVPATSNVKSLGSDVESSFQTRSSCSQCVLVRTTCKTEIAQLKQKLSRAKGKARVVARLYSVKSVNQRENRYNSQVENL